MASSKKYLALGVIVLTSLSIQGKPTKVCNAEYIFEEHINSTFRCLLTTDHKSCLGDFVVLPPKPDKKSSSKFYQPTNHSQNKKDRAYILELQAPRLKKHFSHFLSRTTRHWSDIFYPERTVIIENIERYNLDHYKVYIRNFKNPGRPGFVELKRPVHFQNQSKNEYDWYPKSEICYRAQMDTRNRQPTKWRILDLDGLLTAL